MDTVTRYALRCLKVLSTDLETLEKIDRYSRGEHDDPWMPDSADAEYRLLARKCKTDLTRFIVGTSAQAMYVDGYRRSKSLTSYANGSKNGSFEPEWIHWQRSRMDGRQGAIYRGALTFGHSFVVTEKDADGNVTSKGLSALRTSAIYEDAASDDNPLFAIHVLRHADKQSERWGRAIGWDRENRYEFDYESMSSDKLKVLSVEPHGLDDLCPVTRFTANVDLDGRTVGVVEPMIPLQDRLNQTVFDLLVVQSYGAFKVRTITGMAPPMKTKPRWNGDKTEIIGVDPVIDEETGRPIPENVNMNARRFMFAEDKDTRFGTLDETPLDGYLAAIETAFRHIAALSQTPPHHLLGQIANLSAEALQSAETALQRKVSEYQASFGESWERVFRIAAQLEGDKGLVDDYSGEVLWRDMEQRSMAQAGDALAKMTETLEIPAEGLWPRIPGVTSSEIAHWKALKDEADIDKQMAESLNRMAGSTPPDFRGGKQKGAVNGAAVNVQQQPQASTTAPAV